MKGYYSPKGGNRFYDLVVLQGGFFVEGGGWRVDFRSVIKRGFS